MRLALAAAAVALLPLTGAAAPAGYGFTVRLTYTPRAAAKLAQLGERVTVAAMYAGDPVPAHRRQADVDGLPMGDERVTVPAGAGSARVTGGKVITARLGWIRGPLRVLVNVYSARTKVPDNILDCGIYEGPVAAVTGPGTDIRCDLI